MEVILESVSVGNKVHITTSPNGQLVFVAITDKTGKLLANARVLSSEFVLAASTVTPPKSGQVA